MLVLSWLLKAGLKQLGEACEIGAAMDCGNVLYVYMYIIERKEKKKKKTRDRLLFECPYTRRLFEGSAAKVPIWKRKW